MKELVLMSNRRNFVISCFICTKCGHESIPLARKSSNKKKWGHLKLMYCPHCKKEYNAFEIVNDFDREVFYQLFEEGAFIEDCQRIDEQRIRNQEIVKEIDKSKNKKKNKKGMVNYYA